MEVIVINNLNDVIEILEERENELRQLVTRKERSLEGAPAGCLKTKIRGNRRYHYHSCRGKHNGKYLDRNEWRLIKQLAQKKYDMKVLKACREELEAVSNLLQHYRRWGIPESYIEEDINADLIKPIYPSNREYLENWFEENKPSNRMEALSESERNSNYPFRSRVEKVISMSLDKYGVPHVYEKALYLGYEIFYPDFTITNVRTRETIYWEHCGMMDDPEYVARLLHKLAVYERNGIILGKNLILTFEDRNTRFNMGNIDKIIEANFL